MPVMIPSAELLAQWAAEELWDWRVRLLFATVCAFAIIIVLGIYLLFGRNREASNDGRARRYMGRMSATLYATAFGTAAFFKEPVSVILLVITATVVCAIALNLPRATDAIGQTTEQHSAQDAMGSQNLPEGNL